MDEGYMKFKCSWIKATPISKYKIAEINNLAEMPSEKPQLH
jgi:hypothetical protein